jgi:hypothetical protein
VGGLDAKQPLVDVGDLTLQVVDRQTSDHGAACAELVRRRVTIWLQFPERSVGPATPLLAVQRVLALVPVLEAVAKHAHQLRVRGVERRAELQPVQGPDELPASDEQEVSVDVQWKEEPLA